MHVPEKAIALYERAGQMRPNEAQWPLAMASCTQRVGNYHKALQLLKSTRSKFPENIECNAPIFISFPYSFYEFFSLKNNSNKIPPKNKNAARKRYSKLPHQIAVFVGLRALIRLCTDLGLKEAGDYASDLRKLEHSQSEASSQENNNKRTGTSKKRRQFFYCIFLMTSQFFYIFFFRLSKAWPIAAGGDHDWVQRPVESTLF